MLADILKIPVSKARITIVTTGLGALTTTTAHERILRRIVAMVYAFRDCGGSFLMGNDFWNK